MSYVEENRAALAAYFRSGAKGCASCGSVGVEVEHFVVRAGTFEPVPYRADGDQPSVQGFLEALAPSYPRKSFGTHGELIGLASDEASITLEPAAQIEISIAPFRAIEDVVRVYRAFRRLIDSIAAQAGCQLVAQGYHPSARALDLPLIPKQRYGFMDAYFRALGTHGERMMRATCSTQVSVDYADEADAVRKMRIAQAIAPVLAYVTENVTRFEGEHPGAPLVRMRVWRDVDDARCRCVPGLFDEGFGFEAYASWIMGTCPIFITRPEEGAPAGSPHVRSVSVPRQSADEAYADIPMDEQDIEHVLSMSWPDVRLKRFVEIRPADSLPADLMAGYAALIKGLFYAEESLAAIERALGVEGGVWPLDDESTERAIRSIVASGDAARVHGVAVEEWKRLLFACAKSALAPQEARALDALAWRCGLGPEDQR